MDDQEEEEEESDAGGDLDALTRERISMTMTEVLKMQVTGTVTLKNAKFKVSSRSTRNLK